MCVDVDENYNTQCFYLFLERSSLGSIIFKRRLPGPVYTLADWLFGSGFRVTNIRSYEHSEKGLPRAGMPCMAYDSKPYRS